MAIVPVCLERGFFPEAFWASWDNTVGFLVLMPLGFALIILGSFFNMLPSTEEGPLELTFLLVLGKGTVV